jgi:predicted transcriptional regulator of viral defense system
VILTMLDLKDRYRNYANINSKIKRDADNGVLIPVLRGLYETNPDVDGFLLSSYIYGPSYLSFEYALSYHNLIPERVVVYTSATFNKRKQKRYKNPFGLYTYRDVPKAAFPYFVKAYEMDSYAYFMASPEKALCDLLYIEPPVKSMKQLQVLLFEGLRIDQNELLRFNVSDLMFLSDKYNSRNIHYLVKYLQKGDLR